MRYFYTLHFSDFKQAMKTYFRSSTRRRLRFHLQMWGLLSLGILLLSLVYPLAFDSPLRLVVMPLAVGLIAGGAMPSLLRPWQMERAYSINNGSTKGPLRIYLEIERETLVSGIEGRSEGRYMRASVCDSAEDDRFLLLFLTKKKFIYLPKDRLPTQALDEVRAWLRLANGVTSRC